MFTFVSLGEWPKWLKISENSATFGGLYRRNLSFLKKLTSERHHTNISLKPTNSFLGLKCRFASSRPHRRRLPKTGRFLHLIANNYQFMPPIRNRKIRPLELIDSRVRANFRLNPSWGSVHKPRLFTNQTRGQSNLAKGRIDVRQTDGHATYNIDRNSLHLLKSMRPNNTETTKDTTDCTLAPPSECH